MQGMIDWQAISGWCDNLDIPVQMVLLAAWAYTTAVGILGAGRQAIRAGRYGYRKGYAAASSLGAWWRRPTRLDRVEANLVDLLTQLGHKPVSSAKDPVRHS